MTHIVIEFFGVPRLRTGVASIQVEMSSDPVTLRDVFARLAVRFPTWAADCLNSQGELLPDYLVSLDGDRFVRDLRTEVAAGQTVLILAADAGG